MGSILLRLPGVRETPSSPTDGTIRLDDLPRLIRSRQGAVDELTVVGRPPTAEIGFGLVPLVAAALRPRLVKTVDETTGETTSQPLGRFLLRSSPAAAAQLVVSGAALGAQWAAIRALRLTPSRHAVRPSGRLRRVLYVRPGTGGATAGGSVTHTLEVVRALRERGVDVDAVTTDEMIVQAAHADVDGPSPWDLRPTPFLTRCLPASAALGGDAALMTALRRARQADIIYQRHGRFVLAGALLAAATGTPLFLEYNGSEEYFHTHWQRTPFHQQLVAAEEACLRAAARVIVVSEVARGALRERGIEDSRIVVNPNGVDAARFDAGGGAETRQALGIAGDSVVIGFVGSFGPWHGAPRLGDAFVPVARAVPHAHLLMVGDGAEREAVEQILRDGDVRDRATFTGLVPPSMIAAHLDACDILVAPHVRIPGGVEFFGSPTKLFEYMAAGKAIVASALGQIANVLEDGRTALLVEPGDVAQLSAAIESLVADPALRARLGSAAREAAIAHHGWDKNARRVVEAYEQLEPSAEV